MSDETKLKAETESETEAPETEAPETGSAENETALPAPDEKSRKEINKKIRELKDREEKNLQNGSLNSKVKRAERLSRSLYADVKLKQKRRSPKRRRFLKGVLIYAASVLLITVALAAVLFRFTGDIARSDADDYIAGFVMNTDTLGWRRLLTGCYPTVRAGFEDPARTATEVLSPALSVGNVTWLPNPVYSYTGDLSGCAFPAADPSAVPEGTLVIKGYDLFSDGTYFATALICKNGSGHAPMFDGWQLWNMVFSTDYIFASSGIGRFPATTVNIPEGAVLTVNGFKDAVPASTEKGIRYFECSPGEPVSPACDRLVFDGLYFAPELSAELDGKQLELVADAENRIYSFRYPEEYTHSITVTVPEGVDVRVGGTALTEEWAECGKTEGELGSLDNGGTGTKPMLNVWTVSGLFGDTTVEAEVYGKQLKLLSSDGGRYVFETPPECKYTVTVTCPAGTKLTVNGREVDESEKSSVKADPAEIGSGGMMLGKYDVYELGSIPQALPELDRYVFTGFLALPKITGVYKGTETEPASFTVSAYDVKVEFDCLPEEETAFDPDRVADAADFASQYIKYICGGGAKDDPDNAVAFDANYSALLGEMIPGTAGYVSVMESYRDVFALRRWDGYVIGDIKTGNYIKYTDSCISCTLEFDYTAERYGETPDEITEKGASRVKMDILQVKYEGSFRIWGFAFESTEISSGPAESAD